MFDLSASPASTLPLSGAKVGGLSARFAALLSQKIQTAIFETQGRACDPYGAAWQRTKRGNRPLHGPTGNLLASTRVTPGATELRVLNTVPYAVYHQNGGARLAQRKIVPDIGWPVAWEAKAKKAAVEYIKSLMK